jgi:acetyl-CoA C-acetyltransferase
MRDVYLAGAGQSDFGAFPDESYRSLFATGYRRARDSLAGDLSPGDVDEAFVGSLGVGGRQIGLSAPALLDHVGLGGTPATRVENACAAGGFALRHGVQAIRSGMADVVLAGGVEVMTDLGDAAGYWLGVSGETEYERVSGTTFAGVYAQMADAYLREHGVDREALSRVAAKNHRHGAANPKAHLDFECSVADAEDGPVVADPFTLYHCCPTTDGAAVAVLAAEEVVDDYADERVRVAASGAGTDAVGLFERDTYTAVPAARRAAEAAYDRAGLGPGDVDVAEVHDCFAVAELLACEDLGFAERGAAAELVADGTTELGGALPVNPSGGLKSKGHPIGATGVGQAVELFEQLTGRAGDRQVADPRVALAHNVGGSGGAATVHLFEREAAADGGSVPAGRRAGGGDAPDGAVADPAGGDPA